MFLHGAEKLLKSTTLYGPPLLYRIRFPSLSTPTMFTFLPFDTRDGPLASRIATA